MYGIGGCMSRIRFRILLFTVMISSLFLTGCPGASDYEIDLPSNYSVIRTSGHQVTIAAKISQGNWDSPIIPAKVTEVGWDDHFIIAKQVPLIHNPKSQNGDEIPDEQNDHYWIIQLENGNVTGPIDELELTKTKEKLQISKEFILTEVEDLNKDFAF